MANTTTAQAHGRYIRGSVSKVRRVLDQIRGRTYRDALIMLEFMPYRSTGPITKFKVKGKVTRKGIHAKTKMSKSKTSQNYVKVSRGQG